MCRKLLFLLSFLTISEVQAQSIGCFVDFSNPDFCSLADYEPSDDYYINRNAFGTAVANLVENTWEYYYGCDDERNTLKNTLAICQTEKTTITTNGATCLAELTSFRESAAGYVAGCELRKSQDAGIIRRLKKKLKALRG